MSTSATVIQIKPERPAPAGYAREMLPARYLVGFNYPPLGSSKPVTITVCAGPDRAHQYTTDGGVEAAMALLHRLGYADAEPVQA